MQYANEPELSVPEFRELLIATAFDHTYPLDDESRVAKILQNSDIIMTARNDGDLVGMARAITDFGHACFLCDLAVLPDYRGQGIGQRLIEEVHRFASDQTALVTFAGPEAGDFYKAIGMQSRTNGWLRKRLR